MRCSSTSWPVNRWAEEVGRRTLRRSVLKSHLLELFRRGDAIGPFTLLKDVFGEFHPFFLGRGYAQAVVIVFLILVLPPALISVTESSNHAMFCVLCVPF